MGQSKSLVWLFMITVVLFTVGFAPYFSQEAFAITFTSALADDPDNGDIVAGVGDTIVLTFAGTNATSGGTMNSAEVIANFTSAGADTLFTDGTYTGAWTGTTVLTITITGAPSVLPVIGNTVQYSSPTGHGIGEADNTNLTADPIALTGDFGLVIAVTATTTNGGGGCNNCEAPTLGVDKNYKRIVDNGFTYNGNPIDVERYFTPYPLVTVSVGKQNIAEFKIYDDQGLDNISHLELAFGLANGESIGKSKAVINLDRTFDGVETVTLDDPENVLDNIKVITSEGYCSDESQQKCLIVTVAHTFRAPLDFNILGTNVWDIKRNAWQNYYNHGIEVIGESQNPPKEHDGINAGQIYHLTETSKTTAVDDMGNTWSLKYDQWMMDYIPNEKIIDKIAMNGYARENSQFKMYKYGQYLLAENKLGEMCSECSDESYMEIDNIFAYDYPITMNSFENPEMQKKMIAESEKAQEILAHMFDPILHLK